MLRRVSPCCQSSSVKEGFHLAVSHPGLIDVLIHSDKQVIGVICQHVWDREVQELLDTEVLECLGQGGADRFGTGRCWRCETGRWWCV